MWSLLEILLSLIGFLSVLFQCSLLTVLTLLIRGKILFPNFTEAKRNRQDAKNKCCIQIIVGICCTEKYPEAFLSCLKLCETEVISVFVNTIPDT